MRGRARPPSPNEVLVDVLASDSDEEDVGGNYVAESGGKGAASPSSDGAVSTPAERIPPRRYADLGGYYRSQETRFNVLAAEGTIGGQGMARAASHARFAIQYLCLCLLLSSPRLACVVDAAGCMYLYLRPFLHGHTPRSLSRLHGGVTVAPSLLLFAMGLVRSITLFSVFLKKRQEWTIATSTALYLMTLGLCIFEAGVRGRWDNGLVLFSVIAASAEYILYAALGRRRISPPFAAAVAASAADAGYGALDSSVAGGVSVSGGVSRSGSVQTPFLTLQEVRQRLRGTHSRFLSVHGVSIHHYFVGNDPVKSSRNPKNVVKYDILILPGFCGGVFAWTDAMDAIAPHARRVLAIDLPGFGLSSRPEPAETPTPALTTVSTQASTQASTTASTQASTTASTTVERETQQIQSAPYSDEFSLEIIFSLLDVYEMRQVVVVGHAMGGSLAIAAAHARPEAFTGAVLISPSVYGSVAPPLVESFSADPAMLTAYLMTTREESFSDRKNVSKKRLDDYEAVLSVEGSHAALVAAARARPRTSAKAILPRLGCELLFVHGEQDRLVPLSDTQLAAKNAHSAHSAGPRSDAKLQSARLQPVAEGDAVTSSTDHKNRSNLVVMSRCGHVPHEEAPAEFAKIVAEFLAVL